MIVVSFVRSNLAGEIGNLLKEYRRINVALSRAKVKLVMVGSLSCLRKGREENLCRVLNKLVAEGKVVSLEEGRATGVKPKPKLSQDSDR